MNLEHNTSRPNNKTEQKNPKLEKFLARVDFNLLRTIFDDYAKKSGISSDKVNFLGPEKIVYSKGRGASFNLNNTIGKV